MEVQYVYVKARSQFGKQCFFDDKGPSVEENILPNPEHAKDYIDRTYIDRAVQQSAQFALHEMQTSGTSSENRGMCHQEGGWPREVNPKDPEVTQRYRRRAEKDDNWAPVMRNLMKSTEHCVLQNNAIDIHENYFDDMVPTDLVLSYEARKVNLFVDPEAIKRPISHLSWSSDHRNRLAASYCFMEFEARPPETSTLSYVWDIENPHDPIMTLRPLSSAMSIEFNPHDSCLLAGGLTSGQVCYWDTRIADKPVGMSHQQFSHRQAANEVLWTTSKTNTEFFSSSCDGVVKWWDLRSLKRPTEELVMDLEDSQRADLVRAVGISALQYEHTIGVKCMVGLENGVVVNVNRKGQSVAEKLATRFDCHKFPVLKIDRNPFSLKNFLTIDYWAVKLWADDVKESDLACITNSETFFSGGCWSRARYSVFFTIDRRGILKVYDLLNGIRKSVTDVKICNDRLTTINPHENGVLLAIGSENGDLFLAKCLEGLTTTSKIEKTLVSTYLERTGRFEKLIDNRLKEFRTQMPEKSGFDAVELEEATPAEPQKGKKEPKVAKSTPSSASVDKKKPPKMAKGAASEADLADAERSYFEVISAETKKYAEAQGASSSSAKLDSSGLTRRKKVAKAQTPRRDSRLDKKPEVMEVKAELLEPPPRPLRYKKEQPEIVLEDEDEVQEEVKSAKKRKKIVRKVCPPWVVCKPEVCCRDLKESAATSKTTKTRREKRGKRIRRLQSERQRSISLPVVSAKDKYFEEIVATIGKIPERTATAKVRILREAREPASNVLRSEVKWAREQLESWKRITGYGRHNVKQVLRELEDEERREMEEEAAGKTDRVFKDIKDAEPQDEELERVEESEESTDRTTRRTSGTESHGKSSLSPLKSLVSEDSRKISDAKRRVSVPRKGIDPCAARPRVFSVKDILKELKTEVPEPAALAPASPEAEERTYFQRTGDYPRISSVHTRHYSDQSL